MKFPQHILILFLFAGLAGARGSVVLSSAAGAPVPGVYDQYSFVEDASVSGGNYPYNISAYSDRSPGQTFTTPSAGPFSLTSFSLKGAGDMGGLENATWTITVGTVSKTGLAVTFNSLLTVSNIATPGLLSSTDWLTWTFDGADVLTLNADTMYGIQIGNSNGYMALAASISPTAYPDGYAFAPSQPDWSEYPNPVDFGYDRTFVVGLSAVPEPATAMLLLGGIALCARRSRMKR